MPTRTEDKLGNFNESGEFDNGSVCDHNGALTIRYGFLGNELCTDFVNLCDGCKKDEEE